MYSGWVAFVRGMQGMFGGMVVRTLRVCGSTWRVRWQYCFSCESQTSLGVDRMGSLVQAHLSLVSHCASSGVYIPTGLLSVLF